MELLDNTENKRNKDKSGENILHLEITEVILVHFNMVNTCYQQDSRVLYIFFLINHLIIYQKSHQQVSYY